MEEAQERLSAKEFSEWLAYFQLEPWGEYRDDLRMGVLTVRVANALRSKDSQPTTLKDYIFRFDEDPEEKTEAEKQSQVEALYHKFVAAIQAAAGEKDPASGDGRQPDRPPQSPHGAVQRRHEERRG